MEFTGVDPEALLRTYEALILWFAWMFTAAASSIVLIYLVLLGLEWSTYPRRPVARVSQTPSFRPSARPGVPRPLPSWWRIAGAVLRARPHKLA